MKRELGLLITSFLCAGLAKAETLALDTQWKIQDSSQVSGGGAQVSQSGFDDRAWHPAQVPSTILGNLAPSSSGEADDPFYGKNLLNLPGSGDYYPIGKNYGTIDTPAASPFGRPWWYRKTFATPALSAGEHVDLNFFGITYGAEIWLNGKRIADKGDTLGSYRAFSFDVTASLAGAGQENTLAVLVSPPGPKDLTPSWVDWNPTPQDKNMGLWREVNVSVHGPITVEHPFVSSDIDIPGATQAKLTVEADVVNHEAKSVSGKIIGTIGSIHFEKALTLRANERRNVQLKPSEFSQLVIRNPKLWWPWQMGEPSLYTLELRFESGEKISDQKKIEFGIREVIASITKAGARLFTINGKPIQIRGGGWASDLFLRFSKEREERELRYVRDLGLNTVRLEGRFEPESFLDLADHMGILVMPGWVCCNAWQDNANWDSATKKIAAASIHDQLLELRSHASVFTFLYGSDEAPTPKVEKIYTDAFRDLHWPNPVLASAADTETPQNGKSGVKMNGPYDYTPPSYWYVDDGKFGGAWGFNTETSPGASMPPWESLEKFIPAEHLSAVDDFWDFHTGENEFFGLGTLKDAIGRRYGEPSGARDFVAKAELMAYDGHRAMFEAFGKNKYQSATGVIQWMLNSAWPSMIWHLYDYYLRPGAAYYGVKKADAPLHVQYSYDDQSVVVVNSTYQNSGSLHVIAETYDLGMNRIESKEENVSVLADDVKKLFSLGVPSGVTGKTYFIRLELQNSRGEPIDHNFYWVSNQPEIYDWDKTDFRMTPVTQEADLTALQNLPAAQIATEVRWNPETKTAQVGLKNTGNTLAFFVHLKLMQDGQEVLPVYWQDNYVSLVPGESRMIEVSAPDAVTGKDVEISAASFGR